MKRAEPLLRAEHLGKRYIQQRPFTREKYVVRALDCVSFSIRRATTLAIVGQSGAGKSSLARCLALLEKPDRGEIWFDGERVDRENLFRLHREIQLVFQDPTAALNPRFTAEEILCEPMLIQRLGTAAERRERARDSMRQMGLPPEWATKRMLEFSGGQRQRLALARALVLEPRLLILDEALSSLDLANQEMILRLLEDLKARRALTSIHISHDLRLVAGLADEVAVIDQGRIVEQKPAEQLFARPTHPSTAQLLRAMPSIDSILLKRSA
jgi:ABC-type glutathione transport system ATPase component